MTIAKLNTKAPVIETRRSALDPTSAKVYDDIEYLADVVRRLKAGTFEKINEAIDTINRLHTIKNVTAETSDYSLIPGETVQIDISAASTPLNIAVENGVYEMVMQFDPGTFSADRQVSISPNNTTYANAFTRHVLFGESNAATEAQAANATESSFVFTTGTIHYIKAELIIDGNFRTLGILDVGCTTGGNRRTVVGDSYWNSSTAYTSAGTIMISGSDAVTGVCYMKRVA